MAEKIQLKLVTPSRVLLDEEVDEVTAPGTLGEFGVLPNHISLLATLEIGEVSYKRGGDSVHMALGGGYAEVLDNVMTVLANAAEFGDEIDIERARKAQERTERKLAELSLEDKEFTATEAALHRSLTRLQVAAKAARR